MSWSKQKNQKIRPNEPGGRANVFSFLRCCCYYVQVNFTFSSTLRYRSGCETHRGSGFDPGRHFPLAVPYSSNLNSSQSFTSRNTVFPGPNFQYRYVHVPVRTRYRPAAMSHALSSGYGTGELKRRGDIPDGQDQKRFKQVQFLLSLVASRSSKFNVRRGVSRHN
jgi:hypothetical protein